MSRLPIALLVAALGAAPVFAARDWSLCAKDPFLDPATDICNPLRYIPSLPANALFCALYFLAAAVFFFHYFRNKPRWFLVLPIGTFCAGIGAMLRIVLRGHPQNTGLYVIVTMFVVLSPCCFLAADYILLGRIADHLNGAKYMFIRPRIVARTFVISDIITFLIQAAGGGLSAMESMHVSGARIFLAGLIIQLMSFALFTMLALVFVYRVYKYDKDLWAKPGWKKLYVGLLFTCVCFLIRSVFRTIELSEGYTGFLTIHEIYFMTLDCMPLWIGISVYTWLWPPAILTPETRVLDDSAATNGADSGVAGDDATTVEVAMKERAGESSGMTEDK